MSSFSADKIGNMLSGSQVDPDDNGEQKNSSWTSIVAGQIDSLAERYTSHKTVKDILASWHKSITIGYKFADGFTPHVNGFYMIFMVHGTWYKDYLDYLSGGNAAGLSGLPDSKKASHGSEKPMTKFNLQNPTSYLNMLATDIDVPDLTEEYVSVSSRIRNSFVPSRNYFVSDFNISYIENINLDIMRYHEAWHKYMQLVTRGEHDIKKRMSSADCAKKNNGYFLDMPFANAVWVAVFKPFTTEIQMIIKLIGVMPINLPIKQVIGNRSASKMTVLNVSYKSADLFYKFYNSNDEFMADEGKLATAFRREVFSKSYEE